MNKGVLSLITCIVFALSLLACGEEEPTIKSSGAELTSISVTPAEASISTGASQQFSATGTYSDGSTQDITASVTWTSSDTSKVNISNAGLATAVAAGTTAIKAMLGGISGTATLTVIVSITTQVYSISGSVTASGSGFAGVMVNLSGSMSATVTTDAGGNFSFTELTNGSYAIAPSKSGYSFNPASASKTVSGANVTDVNFTATQAPSDLAGVNVFWEKISALWATSVPTPATVDSELGPYVADDVLDSGIED